jgi:uncharacterized protein (DUF1684 family)
VPTTAEKKAYHDDIKAWRAQMNQSIRAENSWLALAALLWLKQGEQYLHRTEKGEFQFSGSTQPDWLGSFTLSGQQVSFEPNPQIEMRLNGKPAHKKLLASDVDPEPDFIEHDLIRFVVVRRGRRVGLRVWDNERLERFSFPERTWFPINPELQLRASIRKIAPSRKMTIPDVLGDSSREDIFGEFVFSFEGETFRLQALEAGEGQAFVIFADLTNGSTTYPGGRFLSVEISDPDDLTIDFNRAFNPPCAFTPYATCPLPPIENHLPIEIKAGERFPRSQSHDPNE